MQYAAAMIDSLSPSLLQLLRSVDTPTVCNTLIMLDPDLRGQGYTVEAVIAADPGLPALVGYACTARMVSSEPPLDPPEVLRQRRFDYYRYVSSGTRPTVVVMEDCGKRPGYGCIWGGLNVAIHQGLGVVGAITSGALRDLGSLAPGFQLLGGHVCPGSGFAHLVDFDRPVEIFGLSVKPGDLIHADRHGAVVIPTSLVPRLGEGIDLVLRRERVLFDAAAKAGFGYDALVRAWEVFERTK